MLSRKDKLLKKPFEERRYENHLYKIQTAVPRIDNKVPQSRNHVHTKIKKHQKEFERIRNIEHSNLLLLRKINHIMTKKRVDNWKRPVESAKFLRRVPMDFKRASSSPSLRSNSAIELDENKNLRKSGRCSACCAHERILWEEKHAKLDSERVPFVPPKMYSKMERSSSVPAPITRKPSIEKAEKLTVKSAQAIPKPRIKAERANGDLHKSLEDFSKKLVISRGSLQLLVRFPSDTQIKLHTAPSNDGKLIFGSSGEILK